MLIFTYGVSLKDWYKTGLIFREILIYKSLREKKINFIFLTFGNNEDLNYSNILENIKIIPTGKLIDSDIPKWSLIKSLILPFKLRTIFMGVDLIKTNQIDGSWIAYIAKILYKKRIIIRGGFERLIRYKMEFYYTKSRNYFKYLINYSWIFMNELLAYKLADGIILTNKQDIKFVIKCFKLKRKYKKKKISYFPNYIDTNLFKPVNLPKKEKHILFIGSLKIIKNLYNLLEAFIDLKDFSLDIVGKGPIEKNLKNKVVELGVNVNFLGTFPNDKIPEIINQYDIFILPSYYEGNPKALLEAMSCGGVCIGSNISGIKTIIKHKDNGYLCGLTPTSIRNSIVDLYENKSLREKLSINARKYILTNFSLKSLSKKEYLFYQKVLRG